MSFQRKFERDQLRKEFGNKNLAYHWKRCQAYKLEKAIDREIKHNRVEAKNKISLFRKIWNILRKSARNKRKKNRR